MRWICFRKIYPSALMVKYIILDLEKSANKPNFILLNYFLDIKTTVSMWHVWICRMALLFSRLREQVHSLFRVRAICGIYLLTFTYKNHVRMNHKLIGIGSNYFIILLYRIIRNVCNKIFIGIFSTLSLCHKYAWCDRH